MKTNLSTGQVDPDPFPSEKAIRDYAYHLFEQSGRAPGHDLDHWLEAEACLRANIPQHAAHARLRLFQNRTPALPMALQAPHDARPGVLRSGAAQRKRAGRPHPSESGFGQKAPAR
jgi:hypothetical protein